MIKSGLRHMMNNYGCITVFLDRIETANNKIYSFHIPEVSCISKGKDHKKKEFGYKCGFVITENRGILLGSMAFEGNPYDGHALEP